MKRFAALAAILSIAGAANAELMGFFTLAGSDGGSDIYSVTVDNSFAGDVTSLDLSFTGDFVNTFPVALTFADGQVAGFQESFFTLPAGVGAADILGVNTVDDSTTLQSAFTVSGGGVFVPGMSTGTEIAQIAVASGTTLGLDNVASAIGVIGGERFNISFIPEPTTAMLAGLALVGFAARRK